MATQLRWSNRARTGMTPNAGSFKDGNAQWCGYVDTAMHIAGNPKGFTEADRKKAINILRCERLWKLAAQVAEEGV